MAEQIICDICKKPIGPIDSYKRYRVQERKFIAFFTADWINIDAHKDCVTALLHAAKDPEPIPPHGGSAQQDK